VPNLQHFLVIKACSARLAACHSICTLCFVRSSPHPVDAAAAAAAAARHGFQPKPFRETCNQFEYGSEEPPAYDLTKVTAPTIMMLGEQAS
jgi:hypothetical protein